MDLDEEPEGVLGLAGGGKRMLDARRKPWEVAYHFL